jgi:hypothetical protein
MKQSKVWQGSLDALCGIYSLAHVIAVSRKGRLLPNTETAFLHLLQGMEASGFLTAKRLGWYGLHDTQLVTIFNNLSERQRKGLEAIAFRSARCRRILEKKPGKELLRAGLKAVVQEDGGDHWIAVTGLNDDESYCCFDPDREGNVSVRERIRWDQGVLVGSASMFDSL